MGIFHKLLGVGKPVSRELGRNEPCWCGSGKKYKQCHFETDKKKLAAELARKCKTG